MQSVYNKTIEEIKLFIQENRNRDCFTFTINSSDYRSVTPLIDLLKQEKVEYNVSIDGQAESYIDLDDFINVNFEFEYCDCKPDCTFKTLTKFYRRRYTVKHKRILVICSDHWMKRCKSYIFGHDHPELKLNIVQDLKGIEEAKLGHVGKKRKTMEIDKSKIYETDKEKIRFGNIIYEMKK